MSQAPASSPPAASAPAKSGSLIRLAILVVLLLGAIGMWYYDYSYAGPRSDQAHKDIEKFVADQNELGVAKPGDGVIRREEIAKVVGFAPTYSTKNKDYDVEYYCWWGPIPGLNTYKRFITVVYVGPEPRRYGTHHLNEEPPEELLPGYEPPVSEDAAAPTGEPPPLGPVGGMSPPGEGGKKGKGGRGGAPGEGDPPTTDTPSEDKPATEGDKPATEGDKPKEADKPATESDKPAEAPKEGDADKPAAAESDTKPAAESTEPKPE
jgi:hypothetical protein